MLEVVIISTNNTCWVALTLFGEFSCIPFVCVCETQSSRNAYSWNQSAFFVCGCDTQSSRNAYNWNQSVVKKISIN